MLFDFQLCFHWAEYTCSAFKYPRNTKNLQKLQTQNFHSVKQQTGINNIQQWQWNTSDVMNHWRHNKVYTDEQKKVNDESVWLHKQQHTYSYF